MLDIIIIGAGISGSFLAHDLSKYNLKIMLIDKENDIANGTTMANSAIIHTGYDPEDNTLKALLNVKGAIMYEDICKHFDINYKKCGSLLVACSDEEIKTLSVLKDRADRRNVRNNFLERSELLKMESKLSDKVICGLEFPDTAIVYPWECAIALVEEAILNGLELRLNEMVDSIEYKDDHFIVGTNKNNTYTSKIVINAAGCGAEKIAELLEASPYQINVKRGEYYVLSKNAKNYAKHIIFPTPSSLGKGVLVVPTVHDNILLGPNSEKISDCDLSVTINGLNYIKSQLSKTVKDVPYQEIIRSYAGLRASGNNGDFYIKESLNYPNFIHVACIDSPGLASSPAISKYVIDNFIKHKLNLIAKDNYINRKPSLVMAKLNAEEKSEAIRKNPLYAKMICKCENISYGEIVDAIHSISGARTIKAIKKRVRPGMGKCQGGFCEVEVAKIIAKELGIKLEDVLYDNENSKLGMEAK